MDHIYDGERCIFCNQNSIDVLLYNENEKCPAHKDDEVFVYSTETGDSGPTDKRFNVLEWSQIYDDVEGLNL